MKRGPRLRRKPGVEDLKPIQRRFYNGLTEEQRELYLDTLPLVPASTAERNRKSRLVRQRMEILDGVIASLQAHRKDLAQLARGLDGGQVKAESIDLRSTLKPPAIAGVSMRYVRKA